MATVNLGRVGLVLKGDWDETEEYVALDVVSHDGNSWAAKRANTNVEPTTENDDDWQLISNNADLVATVQGYKEDAAASAEAAAESAEDAAASAEKGQEAQDMIATTEESSTASAAHVPGTDSEFFIYDGKLYQATVSIAQGGTITPNTNCKEAPVGASLSELKSAISDIEKWSGVESDYQQADTAGAIYYSNGTPHTSSTVITDAYKYSDFLPVSKDAIIKYKLRTPSDYCMIAFYTSASTSGYVKSNSVAGTGGPVEGTYTVPADGFVVITTKNDLEDKYATYTLLGSHNAQTDARLGTLETEVTPLIGTDEAVINLQHETFSLMGQPIESGFIKNDGTFQSHADYRTTGYIKVSNGETIKYNIGHATTLPIISFYTSKSESSAQTSAFIAGVNGYKSGTYSVSANGFIRFTYYKTRTDSYVVFDENIPDNVKTYLPPNNGVKDLNILCLGDSIFGNDLEIEADLASISGANVINGAFGGTRVTDRGGSDNFQYFDGVNLVEALTTQVWTNQDAGASALSGYPWVSTYLTALKAVDMSTIDLITMDWGTNDYTGGKTIEEITTAYNSVIDMLQSAYPSIRLLIITPIWRYFGAKTDNDNGDNHIYNASTLKEIATAIDENAKDKRIESLQMYQKMPLSYNTADLYYDSGDSTHLNATGNMVYAHILNGKIQSMY